MRTRKPNATTPAEPTPLLPMVDAALQQMVGRGLVESVEVIDLLLDLRSRMVLERALEEMAGDPIDGRTLTWQRPNE